MERVDSLVAFLPVVLLLVLIPGANNVVVVRETLAVGARGGVLATVGTSTGILVWAFAVAGGLGVLLQANQHLWTALQLAGCVALLVLGVRGLVAAGSEPEPAVRRPGGSFGTALLTALLNPRAAIVAVSLLPQFVGPGQDPAATTILLGVTWATLAGAWNLVGVRLVDRCRGWFGGRRGRRTTDLVGGALLVAIGLSSAAAVW
jgi:threonine/homoserine/homoserine lactone efflux protein